MRSWTGWSSAVTYEMNQVCLFTLGSDQPWALDTYKSKGGYETWQQILAGNFKLINHKMLSILCAG